MKTETGWAIKNDKHGLYYGWHRIRREIIAQHVADTHLGGWPAFASGGLNDAQKAAWKKCQRIGDRAVKVRITYRSR